MIKLNTSIPLDEWSRFRKLTRTMEASTALRHAITEWSKAHAENTEPVIMDRDPQVADARPGRPSVKPGIKTMIVHFRIERVEWERFLALSVGLLPNQAPLNAVRWLVATRGGDMEALQRQEEALDLLCNADLSRLPRAVLLSIINTMAAFGAISQSELPAWVLE